MMTDNDLDPLGHWGYNLKSFLDYFGGIFCGDGVYKVMHVHVPDLIVSLQSSSQSNLIQGHSRLCDILHSNIDHQ